jgi:hypothetical protein
MAGYSQAQLDHAARQQGFHDYATYQAYQNHQAMMRQQANVVGTGTQGGTAPTPQAPQPAPPQNWLQRLMWGLSGGH